MRQALPKLCGIRRVLCALVLGLLGALALDMPAQAQNYPNRPIRLICPFPPGGVADVTARVVGQKLSEALGQPVVIENRTGASGTIGPDVVAKSTPDGYTLLMTTGDFITTPTLMPPMAFDPKKDLIPITMAATAPLLLVANPSVGIGDVKELLAKAKAAPGSIAYSSPGLGTINHLAVEWVAIEGGVKLLHVPYRGGTPAATAVLTGEVQIGAVTPSSGMAAIESGKAKVIGFMTKQRPSFTPAWPTLAESGLDVDAALWVGLFAPTGTPAAIVSRLDAEMVKILADQTVRQRLNAAGTDPHPLSGDAFVQRIDLDARRYARIIQQLGLKAQH
jgi:tripartite-type tricarboxylate transporter receptor subunit TctC